MKTLYKSIIVITLASVLLTGCTNKLNYKSEFKKNTSLNNEYKINGEIERFTQMGFFSTTIYNRVILYINNKLVIKTALNVDYSGRTELYYDSKPLIIECGKDNAFSQPKCIIYLDGQDLGTLNFEFDFNR